MKHRLLFVDDEKDILKAYKSIFKVDKQMGALEMKASKLLGDSNDEIAQEQPVEELFSVDVADQGEMAFKKVEQALEEGNPYLVIFLDMRMPPGMDGLETAKKIRELDSKVEFVFVTAYSDQSVSDIQKSLSQVDKFLYLKKPFNREEIRQLALNLSTKYKLNSVKDDFVDHISHELKTPLSSLIGFSEHLKSLGLEDEVQECADIIHKSSSLLNTMIDDLICHTELKNNFSRPPLGPCSVQGVIDDTAKIFRPLMKDNLKFIVQGLDEDEFVLANQENLIQCLLNLLTNANKFTENGGIVLEVLKNNNKIQFKVKDTGVGIDEEFQTFVFDRFYRVKENQLDAQGLGLGLSIVRDLTKEMRGEVSLISKKGKGSIFSMDLKVAS